MCSIFSSGQLHSWITLWHCYQVALLEGIGPVADHCNLQYSGYSCKCTAWSFLPFLVCMCACTSKQKSECWSLTFVKQRPSAFKVELLTCPTALKMWEHFCSLDAGSTLSWCSTLKPNVVEHGIGRSSVLSNSSYYDKTPRRCCWHLKILILCSISG